ncbi:MAG TPA: hypothetical protein VK968_20630, partial [Roseimicrobium sp.]|nr:hypothetical protein [Roseimicrobium sp.]
TPIQAADANPGFKAGDKIEYKPTSYIDKWEEGTVISITPSGNQAIIRGKPNQFYKEGPQAAYSFDHVRPVGTKTAAPQTTTPAPATTTPTKAGAPVAKAGPVADTAPDARGLVTQQEILNFLKTRLGDQPFQNPDREKIKAELAEMIKRRGVNFRYVNLSDFSNDLGKYGASSEIIFPIQDNFGPPTKLSQLMGKYSMDVIGGTVVYSENGQLYRRGEVGAKAGILTINADGTYAWRAYAKDTTEINGKWRKAEASEMRYQGGDALVLLAAKAGWDWIVRQDRSVDKGEWVVVSDLGTRQMREFGGKIGATK